MIYVTLDSNIWIYLLEDSWKVDNNLDFLETWAENQEIKFLIPTIISQEWDRHEEKQKLVNKKKLNDFFSMAEELLPLSIFNEFKQPLAQERIINEQIERLKEIIRNSEQIALTEEARERIIIDGIAKKAPQHKKSSVADAAIVFSLIEFAKENPLNDYYFISNNTSDFFEKIENKLEIHKDLKADFDLHKIKAFKSIGQLKQDLIIIHSLTSDTKIEQRRRTRLREKFKQPLYNPNIESQISMDHHTEFIQDSQTVDLIIENDKPTKNQILYVYGLIERDKNHEREFFRKLKKPNWLPILYGLDVYNPNNIPNENLQYWLPLLYLENLCEVTDTFFSSEIVEILTELIENVTKNRNANVFVRRVIILLLSKFPMECNINRLLLYLPEWFENNIDTGMQSMELVNNLIPSILRSDPTKENIEKLVIILRFAFTIEKDESVEVWNIKDRFKSKVENHHLSKLASNQVLINRIAEFLTDDFLLELAERMREVNYDTFESMEDEIILKTNSKFLLETQISNENLNIKIVNHARSQDYNFTINQFERSSFDETKEIFYQELLKSGIPTFEVELIVEEKLEYLFLKLFNGNVFTIDHQNLSQRFAEGYHEDSVVEILAKILTELTGSKIKNSQNTGVLEELLHNSKYRIPFFKNIVLHLISENWGYTKRIFLDFISKKSNYSIFSNIYLEKELYELFLKNGHNFRVDEINCLKRIIKAGPQNKERFDNQEILAFWKFKWISSLRNVEFFKKEYLTLSKKLNKTYEYFENFDILRPADKPSISSHDFALMKISEIEKYLQNLEINETENNYMISRIYEQFAKEIEQNPGRYSEEISNFQEIPTKYLYHIANGFTDAWKNKREFNWEKVLKFFDNVLSSNVEGKSAHSNRFKSSVADLLSEGTTSDDYAFDLSLMPFARNIILHLSMETHEIYDADKKNFDYPTYTLNSTNGKLVKVLILYSLRKARNGFEVDKKNKLEPEIESIFIKLLEEDVIDLYIQAGWYFKQLNYLNIDLVVKITSSLSFKETFIGPFLGGYQMINPSNSLEIYEQMHPIYKMAISTELKIKSSNHVNYIRHIGVYYLWGIENLNDGSLTSYIIENRNTHALKKLITFFWLLKNYEENLTEEELEIFRNKIMDFWLLVDNKFENPTIGEDSEVLGSLFLLAKYIPKLDIIPTDLITKSIKFNNEGFLSYGLIEDLVLQMERGVPEVTAIYIGKILMSMDHQKHFATKHQNGIINLVDFLYGNDQKGVANQYCNSMKKNGHEFLMSTFTSNN